MSSWTSATDFSRLASSASPEALACEESFWQKVRGEYVVPAEFIHLEYGWYHPCSRAVLATEIEALKRCHARGSHYKRGEMDADREAARSDLAALAGVGAEEIVITRNSTEAINIVINGLPLNRGDAILLCDQEFPSMVQALEQRARREELSLVVAKLPLDPQSDDEVIAAYAAAITPRTKALVITHLINHTGHVLPVHKLCALGRERNLQIFVDAAHSFAHLAFKVAEIDCDYLCSSLHKWLGGPLGTGMLYVRQNRIVGLTPLFADTEVAANDIRKLAHFGDSPDQMHFGLREAIRWHNQLGSLVKEARLRFLQRRWTEVARTLPGVRLLTPRDSARHGAIGVFAVDGMTPEIIVHRLMAEHRIFVNAVVHPVVKGVRVTPGICSSTEDIDCLIAALRVIATSR